MQTAIKITEIQEIRVQTLQRDALCVSANKPNSRVLNSQTVVLVYYRGRCGA